MGNYSGVGRAWVDYFRTGAVGCEMGGHARRFDEKFSNQGGTVDCIDQADSISYGIS